MYEKTFIIEYVSGCKGDFLTNWLNFNKFNNNFNTPSKSEKLVPLKFGYPDDWYEWKQITKKIYKPPIEELIINLENAKNYKFVSGHGIEYYNFPPYKTEFDRRNFVIKKIVWEEKYHNTIFIENYFKNIKYFDKQLSDYFEKNNIENTFKNKIEHTYEFFNFTNSIVSPVLKITNKHRCFNKNKDLIEYGDLYVNFTIEDDDILKNIKLKEYKIAVEKTWLPDKIQAFGHTFDLIKLGYRNF